MNLSPNEKLEVVVGSIVWSLLLFFMSQCAAIFFAASVDSIDYFLSSCFSLLIVIVVFHLVTTFPRNGGDV